MILHLNVERHVVLTGQRHDVARFYWMADAFVLPSFWEGWSLALTEAVYAGLPALATEVGGARELLARTGGRLIKPPFSSICELNSGTIAELVQSEDEGFVSRMAQAMRDTCSSRRRVAIPDSTKRLLDQERMVDLHRTILDWFLQGGHPVAARAWTRTARQSEPVAPQISQTPSAA